MITKIIRFFEENLQLAEQPSHQQESQIELTCIALLIELAKIDQTIDERELNIIREVANKKFNIANEKIDEIIELAKEEAEQATSLYQFTDLVNTRYSDDMKYQLVLSMWKVAFADGEVDKYEEHLIRKISELIYLPHVKFMEAKFNAQKGLASR
ncbi:TerB family tellurite resistance protein [Alkalimarinus sediminis]|uniref:TerB family tellurite resistance protein n=1 Tax=Alkalimarinus sediminis TaxID=1632866 RepID=A0A9E8HKV9_9ALTE|nr:TerB family tellurite resistance protein [Alkalimarinus sediminis]UZW76513.1 TerB family tellurite resistance protein [Alkalimarinus sediminis]